MRPALQELSAPVLIAGGGPVGLTLAADLASRGVECIVAEARDLTLPTSVKCNHVSARSMEAFRRLGLAQAIRRVGLPADYPHDVAFCTTPTGKELARIHIPCTRDRYTDTSGPDGWWPTPEPPQRVNQRFLEPAMVQHVSALQEVRLLDRLRITGFEQADDGVLARAERGHGAPLTIRCAYLVGCDGGRSLVRKAIGAKLHGQDELRKVQSTFIRAPLLSAVPSAKPAWLYYSFNPRRSGSIFAIDGVDHWLVHNGLRPDEDFESADRDRCMRDILGVGPDFEIEVLGHEDWIARRLVVDKMRDGRVFLAGDSAHLWAPYAGYGMNAGIADAVDLAWMLAARVQGWGAPGLLEAYEAERLPITDQVSRLAFAHAVKMMDARSAISPAIEDDSAEGADARARLAREAYDLNVQQFCCAGLNFGYFYAGSPLIRYDDEVAPAYSMGEFQPSTVPGCRVPHFWLADGRSLYDALGPFYTVLRFDPDAPVDRLLAEASKQRVPLAVLDLDKQFAPAAYEHKLLLCRPDQHVAWRGDEVPSDVDALVAMLRGA